MKSSLSIVTILLLLFSVFTSCKQQTAKQRLISKIENYNIDTIEAKPVDISTLDSAGLFRQSVDEVLRHYPEMYHAMDNATHAYNTWIKAERLFIERDFVGKNSKALQVFAQNAASLDNRFLQLNFIKPLKSIIIDDAEASAFENTKLTMTLDEKYVKSCYRTTMYAICDGIQNSTDDYSSDEMRTACERARLAWNDYINATNNLIASMPSECQPAMIIAMREIVNLHIIDLHNCYIQYWAPNHQVPLLNDTSSDEDLESSSFEALSLLRWMKSSNNNK